MKRFTAALIILILIISISAFIMVKTQKLSDEFIILTSKDSSEEITEWWIKNEKFFTVIFPKNKVKEITQELFCGNTDKAKYKMIILRESEIICFKNIF